ncbi:RraA family protein [Paracoccus sp. (in: a-proteobacteria)]|uniref:RraA family protein n=1 Tax=Paracoccus sp. TaxID=267 RepID=UPI0032208961
MSPRLHPRPGDEIPGPLLARWRRIPVAVVADLAPAQQIDPAIRPLLPPDRQPALFGRALTVRCAPPDFGAVLQAVGNVRPGEVLVIAAGGHAGHAMIGDVLGGHLHRQGAAGVVCDGMVRDVTGLAAMPGLSVYARGTNPRGPTGIRQGEVNAPVTLGGCTIAPGDLVLGDADGLAVLPVAMLAGLIEAAEAKLALEAVWTQRLIRGDRIEDIFGPV